MDRILKTKISHSVLHLILLLLRQSWNIFCVAPQGCSYTNGSAYCNFEQWKPPLLDEEFGPDPPYELRLGKINGTIPAGAFSGLDGPHTNINTFMKLFCCPGCRTRLSRSIFTPNLHWVSDLWVYECYLENGLPSRLLENLRSLKYLNIAGGGSDIGLDGLVANDTLAGLINLQEIIVNTPIINGTLPAGFFDGLKNLTMMDLRFSNLNVIPPNWFDGLACLERISLSYNNLQTLPRGLFNELSSMKYVSLQNNPWNCSCELMWLLNLPYITVGSQCQSPSEVKGMKFSDAFGVTDCAPSSTTIPSTEVSSATETKETQISPSATYTGLLLTSASTSLQSEETFAAPVTESTITSIVTATFIRTTTAVASDTVASITQALYTAFWPDSTTKEIRTTNNLGLSAFPSATSGLASSLYSPSSRAPVGNSRASIDDSFINDVRNIILVSTAGAFSIMSVAAAGLFRYGCRNKRIESGTNRVSNGEEERDGEDPRNTDMSSSSTAANP